MYYIYKLINKINKMFYIGQTSVSLKDRWNGGWGYKKCTYVDRAIKKYGEDNFYYEVIAVTETLEVANHLEQYYIAKYNSQDKDVGYNISAGGGVGGKLLQETKQKISETLKGHKVSDETRERQSKAKIGVEPWNKNTIGVMKPISASFVKGPWNTGLKRTFEERQKQKKLTDEQEIEIKLALDVGVKQNVLVEKYKVSQSLISKIKMGKNIIRMKDE